MKAAIFLSAAVLLGAHTPAEAQDASAGKQLFEQCAACHSVEAANSVGPSLKGIVGRKSGTYPGFRFSRAMKGAGIAWDEAKLDAYLADPQKVVPGNVMPFSGMPDAGQRSQLILYLKTIQ